MSSAEHELEGFYRFAKERLATAGDELSVVELVDLWQIENPSAEAQLENVAAIRGALDDMGSGDAGRPVADVIAEMRRKQSERSSQ